MERRSVSLLLAALILVATAVALGARPTPAQAAPRNPSDGQIGAAKRDKSALAANVGRLKAEVAAAAGQMQRLNDEAELAGERYNKAEADFQIARARTTAAQHKVEQAGRQVGQARQAVGKFARDSYIFGSTFGPSYALLDAHGPSDFIERAGLLQAAGQSRTQSLGHMQEANVAKANAQSSARAALRDMTKAKAKAAGAKRAAIAKVTEARDQMDTLSAHRDSLEGQLVEAKARLGGLLDARSAYLKWKHHQEVLAAQRAARLAAERRAAAARAAELAREQAAARERAAEQAAAQQSQDQQSDQSPDDQPVQEAPPPQDDAPPPAPVTTSSSGGGWSAAKGQAVVEAAKRWLGTPYAWAGGTPSGPSMGTAPDEGIVGFDCSGLALYAWAQQGISLSHFSGYQYNSGSHPATSSLLPGDLLFWSYDGTPSSIHHVAIYIGGGQVIEAPQSGDVVKIVPVWYDGLVGATRPGT